MRRTIKYDKNGNSFTVDAALSWMIIFRNEFGKDPVEIIAPALQSLSVFYKNLSGQYIESEEATEIDMLTETLYEFGAADLLCMIWALAKNADENIPPVDEWYKQMKTFDLQSVTEEIIEIMILSTTTRKKARALIALVKAKMKVKTASTLTE
jgi:hypothetical protein